MKDGLDKRSIAYKRRKQAITKAPAVMFEMLRTIVKSSIQAKHVLFDSWFSYPATIIEIFELKASYHCQIKNSPKIKYLVDGEKKTLDAMVAHTAIVLVWYIMLAVKCRNKEGARMLGEIFYLAYHELQDIQFAEALTIILKILEETLQETQLLTDEQIMQFIEAFILKLPEYLSKKLVQKKAS
jgi:hypothetical protein